MQFIVTTIPTGTQTHVAQEVMFPFKGVIQRKILCGAKGHALTYRDVPKDLNRDKWFSRDPKLDTKKVGCKRCRERYVRAFEDLVA